MKKERILKIIAFILCIAMMMCMLTACKDEIVDPNVEDENTEDEEEKDEFLMLYENFEPDEPVMKIGDVEINWGTLYYYFYQEASQLYATMGEIYDWTATYQNGQTYIEYCVSQAIENNLLRLAFVEHYADEYNVTLTDEQIKQMEEDKAYDAELFGDAEELNQYLEDVYLTEDLVEYIAEIELLYENVMNEMYGENGEKLTVEQITELADTAYKMAKVIAIPKDAENAKANAEAALAEIKATPAADVEAKFDELIDKYCEAEKAEELKGGYTFTRGQFFDRTAEDAIKELEKNQYHDGVIEGENYYFVAMRLPVDVDAHPYAYPYYKYNSVLDENNPWGEDTLRKMYVDDIYEELYWDWYDDYEKSAVVFYENIETMDIYEVLGWYE